MKWQPIETCPKTKNPMFVVIAIDVDRYGHKYTSDPYCVWWSDQIIIGDERSDYKTHFPRWPHPFAPTHWAPLPSVKEISE